VCENTPISVVWSPSGRLKAVVFERSCGATTGISTQVSILPWWNLRTTRAGNTLIVDSDHGAAPVGAWGGPEVEVTWRGPNALELRYHPGTRVFKAVTSVHGVHVIAGTTDGASHHRFQPTVGAPSTCASCSIRTMRAAGG
jgi:hypothetical protein